MLVALRRTLILASRYAECQAAKPGVRWAGNPLCANCITCALIFFAGSDDFHAAQRLKAES
jgi:hypothetical protein